MGAQRETMSQLKYRRDVWALGPNQTGYPGGFPNGFIEQLKKNGWWGEKRLWVFSGGFKDREGTTVDIKPECNPSVVADATALPFDDESFDFVCLDPPYSEKESQELYGLPMPSITAFLNEMARVLKPGGTAVLLSRIVPNCYPQQNEHWRRLYWKGIIGVFTIAGIANMRALCVWGKEQTLKTNPRCEPPRAGATAEPEKQQTDV